MESDHAVILVVTTTRKVAKFYANHLENEERYYSMTVSKAHDKINYRVTLRLEVETRDRNYFADLLNKEVAL